MFYPVIKVRFKKGNADFIRTVGHAPTDILYIDSRGGIQYIDILTGEGTEKIGATVPAFTFVTDEITDEKGTQCIRFGVFEELKSIENKDNNLRKYCEALEPVDEEMKEWETEEALMSVCEV